MPGNDPITLALFALGVLCCAILPRILIRPTLPSISDTAHPHPSPAARWTLIALLATLLCAVGALLLVPWSSALAWMRAPGLFLGLVLVILVAVGALYALASPASRRGGHTRR